MTGRAYGIAMLAASLAAASIAGPGLAPAAPKPGSGRAPKTAPPPEFDRDVLELFAADARSKLGPGAPGGKPPAAASNGGAATSADVGSAGGGGFAWSKLVAPATLEDEIKSLVTPTAEATKTPSTFKGGGNKTARINYSVIAALFGVAAQYDGDVRWKSDAVGLRALYARVAANCKVGTDNSFKEAKSRSDDLSELVRGNKIELPKAEAEAKWLEVTNRAPLMSRMGVEGYNPRLKSWTADKGEFSKNKEAIIKEAQILAAIAHIIQDESYEYADDETYLGLAKQLEDQSVEVAEAAKADDLARAQSAVGQVNQACSACHEGYRSGG